MTTLGALIALERRCLGDHEHLEWGYTRTDDGIVFDTSKEAAHPKLLCEPFATLLSMQATVLELVLNPTMSKLEEDSRVATGKQARGRKIPPLISEFDETKIIRRRDGDAPLLDDKNHLTADFHGVPTGSKLLWKAPVNKGESTKSKTMRVFGIFRDLASFLKLAKDVQHPFDSFRAVPPEILKVVRNIFFRTSFVDYEKETGKAAVLAAWCKRIG